MTATLLRRLYVLGEDGTASLEDVRVRDGRIFERGALTPEPKEEVVDFGGLSVLLPAFFNAHTHVPMTLLRGLGEEKPLRRWLDEDIFPYEAHLTARAVEAGAELGLAEMACSGTAGLADMYYFSETICDAMARFGMKGAVGAVSLADDYVPPSGEIRLFSDPHAHYSLSFEEMTAVADRARRLGRGVHTHFLEAPWERQSLQDRFGMTPLEYLQKTGLLDLPHLVLAHCVYLTDDEARALAERGTVTMAHCPASNLKLGSGLPRAWSLRRVGLPVALGTDGAASNNRLDLWAEVRLAALLAKGVEGDPEALPVSAVFEMASRAGYRAFGLEGGTLSVGSPADLQILDLKAPSLCGADEKTLGNFLVYAGDSSLVTDLMIQGRWTLRHRRLVHRGIEEIMERAAEARCRLKELAGRQTIEGDS